MRERERERERENRQAQMDRQTVGQIEKKTTQTAEARQTDRERACNS